MTDVTDDDPRKRLDSLEPRVERLEWDTKGLRDAMASLANQTLEQVKQTLKHSEMLTDLTRATSLAREEAREAKEHASIKAESSALTLAGVDRHIAAIQRSMQAQNAILSQLASPKTAAWVKTAVVGGAALGGFLAALLMKGCA